MNSLNLPGSSSLLTSTLTAACLKSDLEDEAMFDPHKGKRHNRLDQAVPGAAQKILMQS